MPILMRVGGGGGGAEAYAFIVATYPAGSVCTCSRSGVTLTAPGTGGYCVFRVPSAGVWTLSATDGTQTKSRNVSITQEGQRETVFIVYDLWLFREGTGLLVPMSKTGYSFSVSGTGYSVRDCTYSAGMIYMEATSSNTNAALSGTDEMIDLTHFEKLKIEALVIDGSSSTRTGLLSVYIKDNKAVRDTAEPYQTQITSHERIITEIDVSAFDGERYIAAETHNYSRKAEIFNLWLE